jgi:hypothetical protein
MTPDACNPIPVLTAVRAVVIPCPVLLYLFAVVSISFSSGQSPFRRSAESDCRHHCISMAQLKHGHRGKLAFVSNLVYRICHMHLVPGILRVPQPDLHTRFAPRIACAPLVGPMQDRLATGLRKVTQMCALELKPMSSRSTQTISHLGGIAGDSFD